jgi:DNA polymerase III delta prime subunit
MINIKQDYFLDINPQIKNKIDYFLETKKIPHIIFHGSVGTGKRTIVNDFINKIYNDDKQKIKSNVMFVNCAHGKGIKFIREELKFFAKTNIQANQGVIFKTIVLMNADFLTTDAQSALRRCIEQFSYNTRFFIIIENKHRLLKPILSRFCEIYVPEHIDPVDETIINLHTYCLKKKLNIEDHYISIENITKNYLLKISEINKELNHSILTDYSNEMYEHGLSALDIINVIEKCNLFDKKTIIENKMEFNNIKSEYRCEKLLIFYLLDLLFLR